MQRAGCPVEHRIHCLEDFLSARQRLGLFQVEDDILQYVGAKFKTTADRPANPAVDKQVIKSLLTA